jgi:hyperosmotically inducible periplasmic protein
MNSTRLSTAVLALALGSSSLLYGQTTQKQPAADNTQTNKTESAKTTADQQKQNRADIEVTQKIRQSLTKDKALSTYAKNIKVVTQNGNVTLSGPVRTEEEKTSVEKKATDVAGAGRVKSELQIAAKQPDK